MLVLIIYYYPHCSPRESLIVPDITILCTAVHTVLSFSFSFSTHFLAFRPALGMQLNRKAENYMNCRTQKWQNPLGENGVLKWRKNDGWFPKNF